MSILARNITKRFGKKVALDNVTIEAPGAQARWLWDVTALGAHDTWAVGSIGLDFLIMRGC